MEKYGYIYVVIDLLNKHNLPNPYYIGRRKGKFRSRYYGSGKIIKSFVKKYGRDNFKIKVIDCASSTEELDKLEQWWIKDLDCRWPKGYNIAEGGRTNTTPHKQNCQCSSCKAKRGEPRPHKEDCQCLTCKKKRGEHGNLDHKDNCTCFICKHKRGEPHKQNCQCASCRSSREYIPAWNKNKKGIYSKESINKMSKTRKGKTWEEIFGTEKAKELKLIKRIAWNKGLTKETDMRVRKYSKSISRNKRNK
jgi:hypothetical protein